MGTLKYTIIKTEKQHTNYVNKLESLIDSGTNQSTNEIELLALLIEKWEIENDIFQDVDPIALLKRLMKENQLNATKLGELVGLSKGTISKILNYHKGLSKETIRELAVHFKLPQAAFNRHYKLIERTSKQSKGVDLKKINKQLQKKSLSKTIKGIRKS